MELINRKSIFIASCSFLVSFAILLSAIDGNTAGFGTGGIVTTEIGITQTGKGNDVKALAIQPDGKLVAAGSAYNGDKHVFALARYKTDGNLDTTFGAGGIVTTPIRGVNAGASGLAVQSDRKLVAAGSAYNGDKYLFVLARYKTDGSPDASFGAGGIVTTPIQGVNAGASALAIQPDGKLVAAGYGFTVVRYNTDGSLDPTFGSRGIVTRAIERFQAGTARALVIQADGKVVAAGYSSNLRQEFALVRYNANGSLDTAFGKGGIVTTAVRATPINDQANALAIQSDGKLVAAGFSVNGNSGPAKSALVRYHTDGSLDTTFGIRGIVTTAVGTLDAEANALTIQPDGKLVSAGLGYVINGSPTRFVLVRYGTGGNLDRTFGVRGIVTTSIGIEGAARALVIQSDGKLVAAGYSYTSTNSSGIPAGGVFALARYTTDGNLDTAGIAGGAGKWPGCRGKDKEKDKGRSRSKHKDKC